MCNVSKNEMPTACHIFVSSQWQEMHHEQKNKNDSTARGIMASCSDKKSHVSSKKKKKEINQP